MKITNSQFTKIVATIGPASSSYEALLDLVKAGADVFRLNFSHGTHEQHLEVIQHIEAINNKHNLHIGILADLQGPKIRTGDLGDGVMLEDKSIVTFVTKKPPVDSGLIHIKYVNFAKDVEPGQRVLCDDGKIVLEVVSTDKETKVELVVKFGGLLKSKKGINLPETQVSIPSITKKDKQDLKFILTQKINWIALSFVRSAKEMKMLRKYVDKAGHHAKLIAKIEKPEAVTNIKEIIKASNAIMIARGDLGIEVPIEKVPIIQKNIIKKCIQRARPVIVATQMMENMIDNLYPTRAEVTDVANAVLDGADAVMLSGETSVGIHPTRVVEKMNSIITEAENEYSIQSKRAKSNDNSGTYHSDVMCLMAAKIAEEIDAQAIASITVSGYTAFKISSYRAKIPLHIFSSVREILGTMNLIWGVRCHHYDKFTTTDETIEDLSKILKDKKILKAKDIIINTGSMPLKKRFRTNMLKVTIVE